MQVRGLDKRQAMILLTVVFIMFSGIVKAQWVQQNTTTITTADSVGIGNNNPSARLHVTGNQILLTNSGEARFRLHNSGTVAEWLLGQKSATAHNFVISKKQGIAETDFLSFSPTGNITFATMATQPALTITNAGNVGIGTTTPGSPLDVRHDSTAVATARFFGSSWASVFNNGATEATYIRGGKAGGNVYINDIAGSGNVIIGDGVGTVDIKSSGTISGSLDVAGSIKGAAITGTQGFFSKDDVATCCSPNSKFSLAVSENTRVTGNRATIQFHNTGESEGYLALYSNPNDPVGGWRRLLLDDNQGAGLGLQVNGKTLLSRDRAPECCSNGNYTLAIAENTAATGKKATIQFHNSGQDEGAIELSNAPGFRAIRLLDHQGAGLGLEVTGEANFAKNLKVNGSILTTRVKVAALNGANWNWADYVFDPTYQLKPLESVEDYIKKNKHLEGVPTTKEIEKDGIDIAPVTSKLLEKIEELTLYVIEIKKENELLKKKVKRIESNINL